MLSGCAIGLALAAAPHAARAQAFQGTPSVVAGSAIITTPTATTTDVLVRTDEVVINWTPFDVGTSGNIDFLPAGSVATFTDGSLAQYTVLNRILPVDGSGFSVARVIELNGTVNSTLGGAPGGNIWFYTPTGFVVGSTATMQVGGLILTTDDILFGPVVNGTTFFGPGNTVYFRGPADVLSSVVIQPGAQITANGIDSYVAVVSPRVQQGGRVSANRSVAYIGAEQVDMSINAGLFDISILAGTTDSEGVVHTGTTTGAASASAADVKQIALVAMPKATALTMMLQGAIGYTAAADATNDGSAVILSSGFATPIPSAELASSLGNIAIDNASFLNPTNGYASGRVDITATAGNTGFGGTSTLFAQDAIGIDLSGGGNVGATSDLSLLAGRGGIGGAIDIALGSKGNLTVGGLLTINASSSGTPLKVSPPVDATGGTIDILVDDGALGAQALVMTADAYGQFDPMQGGNAIGGSISLSAINGGSVTANSLDATASAVGGFSDITGGNAIGGTISISSASSILAPGGINLYAYGEGGGGVVLSGQGTGGHIGIGLSGGTYAWDYLTAYAVGTSDSAIGGQGNSALALADAIDLTLTNGANLTLLDDTSFDASAYASADGAAGVSATGGGINISVLSGSILNFTYIQALAQAGINLASTVAPNSTPTVNGGSIQLTTDSGQVTGEHLSLDASAYGLGAVNSAGSATGGFAGVDQLNDSQLTLDDGAGTAELSITADGLGAIGPAAANAFGGTALLSNSDSAVTVLGAIGLSGAARAHDESSLYVMGLAPITGFDATGGSASVVVTTSGAGVASLATTDLTADATGDARTPVFFFNGGGFSPGFYGGPIAGDSGNGTGGNSGFTASGSSTVALSTLRVVSDGFGGISQDSLGTAYSNGDGAGGNTGFSSTGGSQTITSLSLSARGVGGTGADAGVSSVGSLAGSGAGGNAVLTVDGGALTAPTLSIDATGTGGDGTANLGSGAGTDGGAGQGGSAQLVFVPGATGSLATNSLDLDAQGHGGNGGVSASGPSGNGGDGTGGTAAAQLADGAFSLGPFSALADGNGGDGSGAGIGGEGHGGNAGFSLVDTTGPSGARSVDGLNFFASGVGGNGSSGIVDGDAGSVSLVVNADPAAALSVNGAMLALSRGTRAAIGDGFTATISGAPLTIGGSVGIDTARDASVTATQPWNVDGAFSMFARSLTETGTISATGNVGITAPGFIMAETIASGGTTTLLAANGPLAVTDLTSAGDVTAQARSIDIAGSGALNIGFAQATAGDLSFSTAGNLGVQFASSTGAMMLDSTAGAVTATGPVAAGGNFSSAGRDGDSFTTLISGGTTTLGSANGAIQVTDLSSPGAVMANGGSVSITSTEGLTFGASSATAGDLTLSALSVTATAPLSATGNTAITGTNGIGLTSLTSGGNVTLSAPSGPLGVTDLRSGGTVGASAMSIDIAGGAALAFSAASATAGDLSIGTAGDLDLVTVDATGAVTLSSTGGAIRNTGTISGVGVDFAAAGDVASGGAITSGGGLTVNAGGTFSATSASAVGNVGVTATSGIAAPSISSGGTTLLQSAGGLVDIDDLSSTGQVTTLAQGITIDATSALSFAGAQATAGDLRVSSSGDLAFDTASASGAIGLTSSAGSLTATGPVSAGGTVDLAGANGLSFAALGSGGATMLSSSGGAVAIGALSSAGNVTAAGRSINIASPGALSFADVQATGGNIRIFTAGNLLIGNGGATGSLDLTSTGGIVSDSVTPSGSGTLSAGGTIALDGNGGISFAALTSGDTVSLASANGTVAIGDLQAGGPVSASGLGISLASSGGLTVANADATGGDISVSTAGNLTVGSAAATGGVNLASSGGDLRTTGAISGNSIDLAGGAIAADAAVTSAGTLAIDARGTLSIGDTATGTSITARAADIAIAAGGQLGTRGQTLDLTLVNRNPATVTTIGDTGMAGGFALSNAEAGRLFADQSITLSVAPSTAPTADLVIGALAMTYGATGNIGTGGVLKIDTLGRVAVNGAVALATTSADDTFSIDPSRIDVIAGSGSIIMANASGTPTGRLGLDAGTIAVADQPTLDAIAAAPNFAAIGSALDTPGAAGPAGGYLQAGSIEINAIDAIYIQNSGASSLFADRQGFTADNIFITTASPDTMIAINGVLAGLTGLDTVGSVTINDIPAAAGGRFDPLSSVNGCIIGANCSPVTPEPGNPVSNPTGDELDQPLPDGSITGALLAGPLVQIQDNAPLITPPLVDEPITGVGNDDLWQVHCDSSDKACPAGENGE